MKRLACYIRDLFHEEVVVLVLSLAFVACVLGFAAVADKVVDQDSQAMDEKVVRSLRSADDPATPVGPPWVATAARDISALGDAAILLLVTAGAAGFLYCSGSHRGMWLLLVSTIGGAGLVILLKDLFARPRPMLVPHLDIVSSPSFPSGHSVLATVVYLTLGALTASALSPLKNRIYVLVAAACVALLVGISRVFLGVHYPTDVLAGWMIGSAWAIFCWWLVHRWMRPRTLAGRPNVPPSSPNESPVKERMP